MNRYDVASVIAPLRHDAAVLTGPGIGSFLLAEICDRPMTIYNVDMAYVTAMALGVSLGWPALKVISVEGDGSLLMGQSALTTVGRYQPKNLIILVFDNGRYLTTGSGTSTTATTTGADIELMGKAAGISKTATVRDVAEMRAVIERAFKEPGPWLIVTKIDISDRDRIGEFKPLPTDCFESGQRFRSAALSLGAPTAASVASQKA